MINLWGSCRNGCKCGLVTVKDCPNRALQLTLHHEQDILGRCRTALIVHSAGEVANVLALNILNVQEGGVVLKAGRGACGKVVAGSGPTHMGCIQRTSLHLTGEHRLFTSDKVLTLSDRGYNGCIYSKIQMSN